MSFCDLSLSIILLRMNSFRQPPHLQKGNTIGIVATAKKMSIDEIKFAVNLFESWGLHVKIGNTLSLENHQFAGTDAERTADFQSMLDDDDVKAIICARGGYGTVRMIDALDFTKFLQSPKWICGYSDITVLHCHLNFALGVQSLHSTMPINFATNTIESLDSLRKALFGEPLLYKLPAHPLNILGSTESIITGGNLSVLYSLTGTKTLFNNSNHILFLEDLDEYLYHIDRMMMNLKRGGKLNKISALMIGAFTDMKDNPIPFGTDAFGIIHEYAKVLNIPTCFDFPVGHIQHNLTLILGKKCQLKIEASTTELSFC